MTPAVICGLACSDDGRFVSVSSLKGTAHVFQLPPLHGRPFRSPRQLNVITRLRLGSVLLHEGLLPQSAFVRPPKATDWPWMYVATRAGTLAVYKLTSVQGPEGALLGLFATHLACV